MPPDAAEVLAAPPAPEDPGLPDLLVIGDSHSNALVEGCIAHGLRVEMLRFSGNHWHAGTIGLHPEHGLWIRDAPVMQRQILDLRERLGGRSVLSPDLPVLATLGYHLGRLVPPFGMYGHVTEARHFDADPGASYSSLALTHAYVGAFRGEHIRLARRIARLTPLTLVAPPFFADGRNTRAFIDSITNRMRAVRLRVCDPSADLCLTGLPLDPAYLTPDGNHGNADYGRAVIGIMLEKGLIVRRA